MRGLRLLDAGTGSGLFSLAARRLGAAVCSFDRDQQCLACARELKKRYFPDDDRWAVAAGSVLDEAFIDSLGTYDVVYCWGVLHHTGDLWRGLDVIRRPVDKNGLLCIAVYNDQGWRSAAWKQIKRFYCSGKPPALLTVSLCLPVLSAACAASDVVRLRSPLARYRSYGSRNRGMSVWHDWIDWLGGYPFEVASPESVIDFYQHKGYTLVNQVRTRGWGNNQFVFRNSAAGGD
jgi:2-polyprenyl-6-hydroxyphenyl methylase/3-demethylubiquinone-9 3-methyltransferase